MTGANYSQMRSALALALVTRLRQPRSASPLAAGGVRSLHSLSHWRRGCAGAAATAIVKTLNVADLPPEDDEFRSDAPGARTTTGRVRFLAPRVSNASHYAARAVLLGATPRSVPGEPWFEVAVAGSAASTPSSWRASKSSGSSSSGSRTCPPRGVSRSIVSNSAFSGLLAPSRSSKGGLDNYASCVVICRHGNTPRRAHH